jgi:tubulin--tyrosine ligase like protein 10
VDKKIQEIMQLIFLTIKDKLDRKFGCFELFGFDFLIDDNLNPYLIEINTNPALYTDTLAQKELLPKLVEDIVKMSLAAHPFGKLEGH